MTDTEDMELPERKRPLAGYAAEARRGDGRLVLLGAANRNAAASRPPSPA